MISWLNNKVVQKLTAILIASVFVVVMFACFTTATNHGHNVDVGAACETVMNLVDNAVAQTGLALLLVIAAAYICFRSCNSFSCLDSLNRMQVFHGPPQDYQASPQEHSYLQKLFSAGLIHSKLHSSAV
jgi:hypothetical protein